MRTAGATSPLGHHNENCSSDQEMRFIMHIRKISMAGKVVVVFLAMLTINLMAGDSPQMHTNPIIPGDWSDPGVVRVAEERGSRK